MMLSSSSPTNRSSGLPPDAKGTTCDRLAAAGVTFRDVELLNLLHSFRFPASQLSPRQIDWSQYPATQAPTNPPKPTNPSDSTKPSGSTRKSRRLTTREGVKATIHKVVKVEHEAHQSELFARELEGSGRQSDATRVRALAVSALKHPGSYNPYDDDPEPDERLSLRHLAELYEEIRQKSQEAWAMAEDDETKLIRLLDGETEHIEIERKKSVTSGRNSLTRLLGCYPG